MVYNLLDTGDFDFGIPEIQKYKHIYNSRVPQTLDRQQRLLRSWEATRESMHAATRRDQSVTDRILLERISRHVDFAFNFIPFYRKHYSAVGFRTGDVVTWNDFACLPTVSKADLIAEYPHSIVANGIDIESCHGARTSGSTGKPLTLVRDDAAADRRMLEILRQFETMLDSPLQREDWIYNIYHSHWVVTSLAGFYRTFSVSQDCPPEAILRHISSLRPRFISSFPSFLARFQEVARDLRPFGVECISTNSESSTVLERQKLADHFKVPVLDEYSSEELPSIAIECPYNNYHVEEDRTYLEIVEPDNESVGRVVGTDLANIYMPIIRYEQGDLARWAKSGQGKCPCGNCYRHLDRLHGRADQAFFSSRNGKILPDRVLDLVDKTLIDVSSGIAEFRVVQKDIGHVEILCVMEGGKISPSAAIVVKFEKGMNDLFGCDISVRFNVVQQIPALSSYKRRMIINEIK